MLIKSLISLVMFCLVNITMFAALPLFVPFSCDGGGSGWMVYEDLNNDGYYDWLTFRDCDGSITAGRWPPQPTILVGSVQTENPTTSSFAYISCEVSNVSNWVVTEKNSENVTLAVITQNCNFNITVDYPPTVRPTPDVDHKPKKSSTAANTWSRLFPNPSTSGVTVIVPEISYTEYSVVNVEIVNISGKSVYLGTTSKESLVSGYHIGTSLMPEGSYSVRVTSPTGIVLATQTLVINK